MAAPGPVQNVGEPLRADEKKLLAAYVNASGPLAANTPGTRRVASRLVRRNLLFCVGKHPLGPIYEPTKAGRAVFGQR